MIFERGIIDAYLRDENIKEAPYAVLLEHFTQPDGKRKDVVKELCSQLEDIVEEFPTFNPKLWMALFPDMGKKLEDVRIIAVVGCKENRLLVQEDETLIFIDLIHIADYTRIVSQMVYVLQNYVTFELARLCIRRDFPIHSRKYMDLLNHLTFTNGLTNYLAWNEDCAQYRFYMEKYEPRKEKAFGLLAQAMEVENKALQHKILISSTSGDFWNQFPAVAGMFYFDDIYRDLGKDGIQLLYRHGPKSFIQTIFHGGNL